MTVGEWLDSRTPRPPAVLAARLAKVLDDAMTQPASGIPELFLSTGEALVARLLRSDSTARVSALDLLAADALLTYAFEAAGADVATIDARATTAMQRIAALATAPATAS